VRLSYVSYSSLGNTGGVGLNPADLQMPAVITQNQAFQAWPTFNLGENTPTLGATSSFSREEVYSGISTWNKLQGAHSIKFGVDYRLNRINNLSPGSNAAGSFNISPTFTQSDPYTKGTSNTSGSAMATVLLGLADTGNFGSNSATSIQNSYTGLFVQDDWKVSKRLTLNFGVRYELETPYTERYNRQSLRFDANAPLPAQPPGLNLKGGILFAGVNGNPRAVSPDKNNFGPRFGFAWTPADKTVIRGGYGIFYSTIAANTTSSGLGSSTSTFFGSIGTFNSVTPFVGSTNNLATPGNTLANPFPSGLVQPVGSSQGLMALVGNSLSFFNDARVNPYAEQWQIDIQRELPSRLMVDIAYTGMHSLKEIEGFNLNELPDV
jgi:outer membrane receptor protein involved in Fe transport